MPTSNSYDFNPPIADLVIEAMERLQIYGPSLETRHILSARRSLNLVQLQWLNRGVNLWATDQIAIPLISGQFLYSLPAETINLLDSFIRTYTPSSTTADIGTALTAVVDQLGAPVISTPYGDVVVAQPGLGVLSVTAGSQLVTMDWPAHGLAVGYPIFWGCPIVVGGISTSGFTLVSNVIDSDTLQFLLPTAARESTFNGGGTPLFYTQSASSSVICIRPGHGLVAGATFPVTSTTVGGITLDGTYTVDAVTNAYQFSFTADTASSTATAFENGGQLNVASQSAGVDMTDVLLWPISRNDYAAQPNKLSAGRPTTFWFDRIVPPVVNFWPVPPTGSTYGFIAYRMRRLQDANPSAGQILDMPDRFIPAVTSALTAELAEKFAPSLWRDKIAKAQSDWEEAALEDREKVSSYIRPALEAYY